MVVRLTYRGPVRVVVRLTVHWSGASGGETHRTTGPVRVVVRLTVQRSSASGGETHRTLVQCEWW